MHSIHPSCCYGLTCVCSNMSLKKPGSWKWFATNVTFARQRVRTYMHFQRTKGVVFFVTTLKMVGDSKFILKMARQQVYTLNFGNLGIYAVHTRRSLQTTFSGISRIRISNTYICSTSLLMLSLDECQNTISCISYTGEMVYNPGWRIKSFGNDCKWRF